jgi:hypothetical protein
MIDDEDMVPLEYAHDLPSEPEPVDENSLSFILGKALRDIENVGGLTRAKLADLVGRDRYNMLLSKPRVADAIDRYVTASPQTKKAAGKMLAMHVARSSDRADLADRVERELADARLAALSRGAQLSADFTLAPST